MPSRANAVRRSPRAPARVIELDAARELQKLARYREQAEAVLVRNREVLQRLFESGLVFTRHGTRVGRDLLQAHRHLLRVVDMVSGGPTRRARGSVSALPKAALFHEIEELLEKTSAIARRNRSVFQPSTPGF